MARPVALPVLLRLRIGKTHADATDSKNIQARALANLIADRSPAGVCMWSPTRSIGARPGVPPIGPAGRPETDVITFTTRLASTAVLYGRQPPRTGRRGHPRWKGDRLGTPAELAAAADQDSAWRKTRVTRYSETEDVHVADVECLWWGSLHRTPVRVILVRGIAKDTGKPYDLALVTTDPETASVGPATAGISRVTVPGHGRREPV